MCQHAVQELAKLRPQAEIANSRDKRVQLLRHALGIAETLRTQFAALPPPRGDEATIGRIVALQKQLNDRSRHTVESYASGDDSALSKTSVADTKAARALTALLGAYGFTVCGRLRVT